jgi:uncharacterized membrane protein
MPAMNLGELTPDPQWVRLAWLLLLPVLLAALFSAPWRALMAQQERMTALGAAIAVLPLLWSMSPDLAGGEQLHLLGMTTVTLMFGWQLAIFAGMAAGLILLLVGSWGLEGLAFNLLLTVIIPVVVSTAVLLAANRLRRTNLFVYMLGVGFVGSMAALGASLWFGSLVLGTDLDHALVMLLVFPEGFINGAVVSAFAVFAPDLLRSYDDERYLGKRR